MRLASAAEVRHDLDDYCVAIPGLGGWVFAARFWGFGLAPCMLCIKWTELNRTELTWDPLDEEFMGLKVLCLYACPR